MWAKLLTVHPYLEEICLRYNQKFYFPLFREKLQNSSIQGMGMYHSTLSDYKVITRTTRVVFSGLFVYKFKTLSKMCFNGSSKVIF